MISILQRFAIPDWVSQHTCQNERIEDLPEKIITNIRKGLESLKPKNPEVSIILPAFNEERFLLGTLSSLSKLVPIKPTELIVANNNSTDGTEAILNALGIKSIIVERQGVTYARQYALEKARGMYVLSADADTIYPPDWGNDMVRLLVNNPKVACVHGKYSFIPSQENTRWALAIHEFGTDIVMAMRSKSRPYFNVMGCNCAFRREQALAVGGYDHTLFHKNGNRGEDGYLAINLMRHFGEIRYLPSANRVWTSDRRLVEDGSHSKAVLKRFRRYLLNDFNPFKKQQLPPFSTSTMFFDRDSSSSK